VVRLASRVAPFDGTPFQFRDDFRQGITALGWDSWVDPSLLRSPNGNVWPETSKEDANALRWSTIHSFKGLQAPVVAMAIPAPYPNARTLDGVGLWQASLDGENRHVLYVGASRARAPAKSFGDTETVGRRESAVADRGRGQPGLRDAPCAQC